MNIKTLILGLFLVPSPVHALIGNINEGIVTTAKLADGAVTTSKLHSEALDPSGDLLLQASGGAVGIGNANPDADSVHINRVVVMQDNLVKIQSGASVSCSLAGGGGDLCVEADGFFGDSLRVDDNAYFGADGSGSVGIGTTSPDGTLHAHTATAGSVTPDASGDDLTVENSGNGGITILAPDASDSNIYWGSPSNNLGALLRWNRDADLMTLGTNDAGADFRIVTGSLSEALRVDQDGNMGVGTSSPVQSLHVQDGVILSSTTSGFGPVQVFGSSGGCLMIRDTDDAGWTQCTVLDGTLSCAADDGDGVCD